MTSISEFELRQAHASDAEAIALAHLDAIATLGAGHYPPDVIVAWSEGVAPKLYLDAMARGEVFFIATAEVDGEPLVLGFSSDYTIEGSVHGTSVYVRGLAARRGIGSSLMAIAEAHAVANGATEVRIEASLAGVAFYRAHGYVETGAGETHLTSGRPIACVFMRKTLAASGGSG